MIIPSALRIKIETIANGIKDLPENPAHEGLVVYVDWPEPRNLLLLLNQLSGLLLVNKRLCFFFNSKIDDLRQLFIPDLLTMNIQEILNILNGSLKTANLVSEFGELLIELLPRTLLLEDEVGMESFSKGLEHFFSDSVNEDFLRLDSDDSHQNLVQAKHTFSEDSNFVRDFGEHESLVKIGVVLQMVFVYFGFKLLDLVHQDDSDFFQKVKDFQRDYLQYFSHKAH